MIQQRPHPSSQPSQGSPLKHSDESFAEFADEDLDVDFFESVEKSMLGNSHSPTKAQPKHPAAASAGEVILEEEQEQTVNMPKTQPPVTDTATSVAQSFDVDFDDEDSMLVEEMHDLVDQVVSQNQIGKISAVEGPTSINPIGKNTDYEIDDDFENDDELWAEVAEQTEKGRMGPGCISQVGQHR